MPSGSSAFRPAHIRISPTITKRSIALDMATLIRSALSEAGIRFFSPTAATNQIFPILSNTCIERLRATYAFGIWEAYDQEHTIVRFVTSWATEEAAVHNLIREILKQEI